MPIKFEPLVSQLSHARKPPDISAIAPMSEGSPNGQRGISRLPVVSPLICSMTEAKLPNQTPCKTSVISASASMPKDLPIWAERNRKIAKPPTFPTRSLAILPRYTRLIQIEVQLTNQHFYDRFGFRATSEPFMLDGLMHLEMELNMKTKGTTIFSMPLWYKSHFVLFCDFP